MKAVSIIVPIYNAEKKLVKCIKSILNQTFKDIEVILVNDGSTDNSIGICRDFAASDSRIKLITGVNRGCIHARRLGINNATSLYSMFVDADDWIHKNMVEILHAQASETGADITVCNVYRVLSDRAIMKKENKTEFMRDHTYEGSDLKELTSAYLYGHPFPASLCGKLYKTELLVNSGKYLSRIQFMGEDLYFNLEMFLKAKRVRVIPTPLYYYRTGGTTSKYMSYLFADMTSGYKIQKEVIEEYYADEADKQRRGISIMLLNTLMTCLQNLFNSSFSRAQIRASIVQYIESEEIQECLQNKECISHFPNGYTDAIKSQDIDYLYDMGASLHRSSMKRRHLVNVLSKIM